MSMMAATTLPRIEPDEFYTLAQTHTKIVSRNVNGLDFLISTADRRFGRALFIRGRRPDTKLLNGAVRHLTQIGRPPSGLFVDVGANIGTTTLTAIKHYGFTRAVAIEPEPTNARLIAASAALNGLTDRVEILNVAALDHNHGSRLRRATTDSATHTIARDGDLDVPTRTLDELDLGQVGLLWLDVEGSEGQVLAGARKLLQTRPPIVLEFHPSWLRDHHGLDEVLRVAATYSECVHPKTHQPLDPEQLAVELAAHRGKRSHTDVLLIP